MTKDIIEQESLRLSSGIRNELHLYREGTFLRAYDWSAWLRSLQRPLTDFLETHLNLSVNSGKTVIVDARQGVEFLGAFLKPHRRYVSNRTLHRMRQKIPMLAKTPSAEKLQCSLNSFLGILGHYRSYRLRREMFYNLRYVYQYGYYLHGMKKFMLFDSSPSMSSCICEHSCQ